MDYILYRVGLNIFYSVIKYTEKELVWLKVQHYPLQNEEELQKQEQHKYEEHRVDIVCLHSLLFCDLVTW